VAHGHLATNARPETSVATVRPGRTYPARSDSFATGFQFISSVIGAAALSSSVLMRKRPSRATSYCRLLTSLALQSSWRIS